MSLGELVTTQPEPGSTGTTSQGTQIIQPMRDLIALALVGANAVLILNGLLHLLFAGWEDETTFFSAANDAIFQFIGIPGIVLPLLAVLLTTVVQPITARAKLVTVIAVAEYVAASAFTVIALLGWMIGGAADDNPFFDPPASFWVTGVLERLVHTALLVFAALVVIKIWRSLFAVPKPPVAVGPHGYAAQQGYPQTGYLQGYPQAYGQTYPGYPPGYGQTQQAAPGGYPMYGQQTVPAQQSYAAAPTPPAEALQSAAPAVPAPQSAPPASAPQSAPPAPGQQSAEATQSYGIPPVPPVVPGQPAPGQQSYWGGERTQLINPSDQQSGDDPTQIHR